MVIFLKLFFREFTVKVPVKAAVMGRTAPWSAPAKTLSTAHQWTAPAFAKKVIFFNYRHLVVTCVKDPQQPFDTHLLCSPSRLEGCEMLQPLLGGNLGPRVQRHLPLHKRGQMQPGRRILQLHCRLARQSLRATVPGKFTHT